MARRRRRRKRKGFGKSTQGGRKVRVKGHTRSPRGPNTGKPRVKVPSHARKRPRNRR
jgi:hypothetical protein